MALQLDGVQRIMQGVSQGAAIADMLRRAALDEEAAGRQKARMERETQLQDISIQESFAKAGRPVNGNTVMDKVTMPGAQIPGMDPKVAEAIGVGPRLVEMARRVDPSRVMRAKLSDGRSLAVERYTPEEEVQHEMQNMIARGRAQTGLKIDETKMMQLIGETPGSLELFRQTGANTRTGITTAAQDARNQATIESRRSIAKLNQDFDATQKDLDRKSRKEAATIRAGGAGRITPEQERMRAKDARAELNSLQAQHDEADAEGQRLWAEVEAGDARIKAIGEEIPTAPTQVRLKLNAERGELTKKIATNRLLAKAADKRKKGFLERKDNLRGGAPASGAAAQFEYVPGKGLVKR